MDLEVFEKEIGYVFRDKNLLKKAKKFAIIATYSI